MQGFTECHSCSNSAHFPQPETWKPPVDSSFLTPCFQLLSILQVHSCFPFLSPSSDPLFLSPRVLDYFIDFQLVFLPCILCHSPLLKHSSEMFLSYLWWLPVVIFLSRHIKIFRAYSLLHSSLIFRHSPPVLQLF